MQDTLQALIDGLAELRERVGGNETRPSVEEIKYALAQLQVLAEDLQSVAVPPAEDLHTQATDGGNNPHYVPDETHDLPVVEPETVPAEWAPEPVVDPVDQ